MGLSVTKLSVFLAVLATLQIIWLLNSKAVLQKMFSGEGNAELRRRLNWKDNVAAILAFLAVVVSVLLIWENQMSDEVSRAEFDALKARVEALENGPKPPDGGTPVSVAQVEELEKALGELEGRTASKEEVEELRRIVGVMRGTILPEHKIEKADKLQRSE